MSQLDRFELFTVVAQMHSLTKAADSLGITKASLSKQIKTLEKELKVDLFTRQNQRLHLTAQGQVLLRQCMRIKKELDDARSICQQFHAEPEGDLHVVALEHFAKKLIFPKLKKFLQKYPKLNIFIDSSERIPDFAKEQIDLAVGYSLPAPDDIVRGKITTTRYILCSSPEYFAKKGYPKNLNDLKAHDYIEHKSRTENKSIKLRPSYKLSLKPYLVLNSVTAMIECAKAGIGLVQLPMYLLKEDLEKKRLVSVLEEYQEIDAAVYFYYPKYRYTQPKIRKFIDFFLE